MGRSALVLAFAVRLDAPPPVFVAVTLKRAELKNPPRPLVITNQSDALSPGTVGQWAFA